VTHDEALALAAELRANRSDLEVFGVERYETPMIEANLDRVIEGFDGLPLIQTVVSFCEEWFVTIERCGARFLIADASDVEALP
jgi:hypothetical protein